MRSKKLLILYAFLLIVAVTTMVQLWRFNQRPQEIGPRDYPEIKKEGILRMITEYNQSGYFVSADTVQDFQYELSKRSLNYPDWRVPDAFGNEFSEKLRGIIGQQMRCYRKKHTHHLRDERKLPVH